MSKYPLKIHHIKTIINQFSPKMLYGLFFKERIYQSNFQKLLVQKDWHDLQIKPRGYAANCSLLYFLLRVLHEKEPTTTLELGSGQTTKLFFRYIEENSKAEALVLEEDKDWYEHIKNDFLSDRFSYEYSPLQELVIEDKHVDWYSYNFSDIINQGKKFNLVLIDGPKGIRRFSRLGIVKYLYDIIDKDNFLIIFDDSSRKGEEDTIEYLLGIFDEKELQYTKYDLYGSKKQTCIASENYTIDI